jgi:VWFA-related protein
MVGINIAGTPRGTGGQGCGRPGSKFMRWPSSARFLGPERSVGARFAERLTRITGGRTFPIRNLKKIGNAVDDLALDLRNQYLIAYRPRNLAHDGRWHKVSVSVKPPQGSSRLRVHANAGYYVRRNDPLSV